MSATVAQTLALQHELVRPKLGLMYQMDHTLVSMIEENTDLDVVSSRPTRVPMEFIQGGKIRVVDPDNGDWGLGSGITTDFGTLIPVYYAMCAQYSKQAEISTDSKEKAIQDFVELTMERAMTQYNVGLEAIIQGNGANVLDTVVTATPGNASFTVNNANQFYGNQDIDWWSGVGGTQRGSVTIRTVDAPNRTVYLNGVVPAGAVAGDSLLVSGSSGVANSGLFGLLYYQVNSTTGSVMGLPRSSYPGMLSAQHVAASGALTPMMARASLAAIQQALGEEVPNEEELIYHMNTDSVAAWESVGVAVATVIQNQLGGDSSQDMLKKNTPKTFAGRPLKVSIHATPGRIDGLCLKHWFRVSNQKLDFFEIGGQTLFPPYGPSGGLMASSFFYLWSGLQIGNDNVRSGVYIDGFAKPAFGAGF